MAGAAIAGNGPAGSRDPSGLVAVIDDATETGAVIGTLVEPGGGTIAGALIGAAVGTVIVVGGIVIVAVTGGKGQGVVRIIPDKSGSKENCLNSCANQVAELKQKAEDKIRGEDPNGQFPPDAKGCFDDYWNKIQTDCELQCQGLSPLINLR